MTDKPNEPALRTFCWKRVLVAETVLVGALLAVLPCVIYFARERYGSAGIASSLIAFAVCWVPNAVALLVMGLMAEPQQSVSGMMLSMFLRMGIPLGLVVVLLQSRHWLVDAGVLPMIVVFYLTALVVETCLSLWISGAARERLVKAS